MVVTDVALSDVAEGMIPDETVDLGEGAPAIRESHALDDAGLRELQTRAEAGELDQLQGRLRIQKTIPFAPFIGVGVFLTIIVKGPLHALLR
jgi:hypothetical protein